MSFTPVTFENIGKSVADLFKKKYDFKNQVQLKNRSATGLTITSTADVGSAVSGTLNLKYKEAVAEAEVDATTAGKLKAEVKAKNVGNVKGVNVSVKAESAPKREGAFAKLNGADAAAVKTTVDYTKEWFTGSLSLDTSFFDFAQVTATGVVGYQGLSAGVEAKVDAQARKQVDEYNLAVQYEQKDVIGSIKAGKKLSEVTVGVFHKCSARQTIGASFTTPIKAGDQAQARVFKFGTDYTVDVATSFRSKAEVTFDGKQTEGVIAGVLEHRLTNPSLLFSLSSAYSVKNVNTIAPKEFGIALTFGDYE